MFTIIYPLKSKGLSKATNFTFVCPSRCANMYCCHYVAPIHVNIDRAQLKLKCHHIIYLALIHVSIWRLKPKCKHLSMSSITCGNYPHQHGSYSISKCQHLTMSFTWHLSISTWIALKSKCQHLWMSLNGTQSMSTWIIRKSTCQQLFMSLYGTLSMSSCACLRYKNWFPMTKCRQQGKTIIKKSQIPNQFDCPLKKRNISFFFSFMVLLNFNVVLHYQLNKY